MKSNPEIGPSLKFFSFSFYFDNFDYLNLYLNSHLQRVFVVIQTVKDKTWRKEKEEKSNP